MSAAERLDLMVERRGSSVRLLSPGVGWFTAARGAGDLVAPGTEAGVLLVLGRAFELVVPAGVEGRVVGPPPARTRQPVGWGDGLYEVEPGVINDGRAGRPPSSAVAPPDNAARGGEPGIHVLRSPQSGRLYLRPAPGDEPFAQVGAILEEGQPIGLIEVMKTFAHVRYAGAGLPARGRVTRVLVVDGAEVATGDPLIEIEPA